MVNLSEFDEYKKLNTGKDILETYVSDCFETIETQLSAVTHKSKDIETENKPDKLVDYSVNKATGGFCIEQTDIIIEDINGQFKLNRRYDSLVEIYGWIAGCRWMFNIESVLLMVNDQVVIILPDSHVEKFDITMSGYYNVKDNSKYLLANRQEGGFLLIEKDTIKQYDYNSFGKIESITDRNGNKTEYIYNNNMLTRIIFSSGMTLTMTYEDGKLLSFTDSMGRYVVYQYENDYLTRVLYPDNTSIMYRYYPSGMIESVVDKNGTVLMSNEYDDKGRTVIQTYANGAYYKYIYDDYNMMTSIYDAAYDKWTMHTYNTDFEIVCTEYYDKTTQINEYDYQGHLISKKDRKGNKTLYIYDALGNLIEEDYPNGLKIHKEYDETGLLVCTYDSAGRMKKIEYDGKGNIICVRTKIATDLWQEKQYIYDEVGRIISKKDSRGYEVLYTYSTYFSKPTAITKRDGKTINCEYDIIGRLMRIKVDECVISFEYDVLNRVVKKTDGEGNVTKYDYNRDGRLTRLTLPNQYNPQADNGRATIFEYDKVGLLVKKIMPSGAVKLTKRNYDRKIIKEVMPSNYDTSRDDGIGKTFEYDKDGRCIKTKYPDNSIERVFYDTCGNITKKVLACCYNPKTDNGSGYEYVHDTMNRVVKIINPDGRVEKEYIYDDAGNIIKEIGIKGYVQGKNEKTRPGIVYKYNLLDNIVEKREYIKEEKPGYRLTRYEYDTEGNMIRQIRFVDYQQEDGAIGKTYEIVYEYDSECRLIKESDNVGAYKEYEYNVYGLKSLQTIRINEKSYMWEKYIYDKALRVKEIVKSADPRFTKKTSVSIFYRYDSNGNVVDIITPKENEIHRIYDVDDNIIEEEHIEKCGEIANKLSFAYDMNGNVSMKVDTYGATNSYFYDCMNRISKTINETGGTTIYHYDAEGRIIRKITPNEYVVLGDKAIGFRYEYDIMGRLLKESAPDGEEVRSNKYNDYGELTEETPAVGNHTEYKYDFAGRKTTVKSKSGNLMLYAFDPFDNIIAAHDGKFRMTAYERDEAGRIKTVLHPNGGIEKYSYDFAGNVAEYMDVLGRITIYAYNEINKVLSITYPNGKDERYAYEEEGHVAVFADRNKNGIQSEYNMYGDILTKKDMRTGMSIKLNYYPDGKLKSSLSDGIKFSYEYDKVGRISKKKANDRVLISITYDADGNKKTISDVTNKTISYKHDLCNRITEVTDGEKSIAKYTYYTDGKIKKASLGDNKVIISYEYDKARNISSIVAVMGKEKLLDNRYTYDENDMCILKKTNYGTFAYEYDSNRRLVKAQYPGINEKICYDNLGTRTRKNVIKHNGNSYAEFYKYDTGCLVERIVADPYGNPMGKIDYAYDNADNIVMDGKSEFKYDCFGRLVKSETADGEVRRYSYDALQCRCSMEENGESIQFVYDGEQLVRESRANGNIQYIYGNGPIACYLEKEGRMLYYICDENGSVTHVVDGQFVVNTYDYDRFGTVITWSEHVSNRILFAGRQYDIGTGLYYFNNQYYNPVLDCYLLNDKSIKKESL